MTRNCGRPRAPSSFLPRAACRLYCPPSVALLPPALLQVHVGGGDAEHLGHEREDVAEALLGARRIDRRRRRVLLHVRRRSRRGRRRRRTRRDRRRRRASSACPRAPPTSCDARSSCAGGWRTPRRAPTRARASAPAAAVSAIGNSSRRHSMAPLKRTWRRAGAQADALLQLGVRREHEGVPAGEAVAQDAADLLVERRRARAPRRAARRRAGSSRPRRAAGAGGSASPKVTTRKSMASATPARRAFSLAICDGARILVEAEERRRDRPLARARLVEQPLPHGDVVAAPAVEAEALRVRGRARRRRR